MTERMISVPESVLRDVLAQESGYEAEKLLDPYLPPAKPAPLILAHDVKCECYDDRSVSLKQGRDRIAVDEVPRLRDWLSEVAGDGEAVEVLFEDENDNCVTPHVSFAVPMRGVEEARRRLSAKLPRERRERIPYLRLSARAIARALERRELHPNDWFIPDQPAIRACLNGGE